MGHDNFKDNHRLIESLRDQRASLFFAKRISIAIQLVNAASLLCTFPDRSDVEYLTTQFIRYTEMWDYMHKYYFNTLGRASPFFVGLLLRYILHLYRKSRIQIDSILAIFIWACSAGILGAIFYFKYRMKQFEWDNDLMDNLMNSFMRPAYACAICWLIVACQHGYSGPINWFLSLDAWRLSTRLTYGMFLFHYPLMFSLNAGMVAPIYFSVGNLTFKFLSYLVLALVYSFIYTLLIDNQ